MDIMQNINEFLLMADKIVRTVMTERNQQRLQQVAAKGTQMFESTEDFLEATLHDAQECSKIIMEIVSDILRADGHDVPNSRAIIQQDIREHFEKELKKRLTIIQYRNN